MDCMHNDIDTDYISLSQKKTVNSGFMEWELSRKLVSVVRSGMKTTRAYDPSLANRLTTPINILGLNALFSLQKCPQKVIAGLGDFSHHFKMGDYGWAAISGVEVGTIIGDGLDSLGTVMSCLNSLDERVPYSCEVGLMMHHLVINVTAVAIVLKLAEIFQTKRFIDELKRKPNYVKDVSRELSNNRSWKMKKIEASVTTSYKKKLERITSSHFAAVSGKDRKKVLDFAEKKLTVGYVSLAASTTALCALKMLLNPLIPPAIPLAMLTGVSVTRVFTFIYEKHLGEGVGAVRSHSSGVKGCKDKACKLAISSFNNEKRS